MDELKEAVVNAAKKWKSNPERYGNELRDAVDALVNRTCPKTAIGGDPAWPYVLRCTKEIGHEEYHQDPRGPWRERN